LKPTPKPEGDFELPKKDKGDKSFKDSYEDGIKKTRNDYDHKIYDSIKKEFQNEGYDDYLEQLEELDKEEVGILVESNDGANKLLDYQEEKEKGQDKVVKDDFRMDEKDEKQFHHEPQLQSKNELEPDKKIEQNKEHEIDFRMDEKQADNFHETIESNTSNFDDKSKDIDKNNLQKEQTDFQKISRDISDDFQ
jgi:hypothetical protein